MNHYTYDPNVPYGLYLRMEPPVAETPVELTPREALLIGSPEFIVGLVPTPFVVTRTEEIAPESVVPTPVDPVSVNGPASDAPAPETGATDLTPATDTTAIDAEVSESGRESEADAAGGVVATATETEANGLEEIAPSPALPPAQFHWGYSEWLMEGGDFSASLTALKHRARTSDEMWAYEQFDVARTAFRRGLFQEALEYLRRAIHGHEARGGYALDYRFHFLQGLIQLGGFRHHDPAYLNLEAAEQALATAGRYARCDHPADAGWAYLAAGWAAYCRGEMPAAMEHTRQAIALQAKRAEAHFQAAKIAMHLHQPEVAKPALGTAIGLDPHYALAAMRDGDFDAYTPAVADAIDMERQRVGQRASRALHAAVELAKRVGAREQHGQLVAPAVPAGDDLPGALGLIDRARAAFRDNTLYGYCAAEAGARHAAAALTVIVGRGQKAKLIAEDMVQTAKEAAAQIAALQIGSYRLGTLAIAELNNATGLIAEAEAACRENTLPGHLAAEQHARRALAALRQTVEAYKTSAIEQALAERRELERKLGRLQQTGDDSGSSTKTFFAVAGIGVLLFGGYFVFSRFGDSSAGAAGSETLIRLGLAAVIVIGIAALLIALVAPFYKTDGGARAGFRQLEERREAMDRTIGQLRGFSIEKLRPSS